jgi:hypothetical protein
MRQRDKARCPWAKTELYVQYHDAEWGAGELAGVMAGPQDQVIDLGDGHQFLVVPTNGHYHYLLCSVHMYKTFFTFRPPSAARG